jgi:UDP-N-acetylmuramyl pentapeptide synthase
MNKVFLTNTDIIEIIAVGDQSIESIDELANKALDLIDVQSSAGKPALILGNLLQLGATTADARARIVRHAQRKHIDKFALVGTGASLRITGNLVLQATGLGDNAKYFEDYDEAVRWILSND